MLDCQAVGAKIHQLRVDRGLNQDQIAETLYVSRQAVSRWELGQTMPSIDNLVELCKIFHTSFEEVLCLNAAVTADSADIFAGHDRLYVIRSIIDQTMTVDLAEVFDQFSAEERLVLLKALKEGRLHADAVRLKEKLTSDEINYLKKEVTRHAKTENNAAISG